MHKKGLVKTVQFDEGKYVGDPINAVKIFNEKRVDELIVLDIDATRLGEEPDLDMIRKLAAECRMPFCYGGGVKSPEQAKRIIGLGVEKVALSAAAVDDPGLVSEIASELGSQSVIVVLDVKKKRFGKGYEVWTRNGRKNSRLCPLEFSRELVDLGVGELVINSIANDGMMKGYDIPLLRKVKDSVTVPITALGGAGSLEDLKELFGQLGTMGAAAGSLFVFKGPYKAVLINYPDESERSALYAA